MNLKQVGSNMTELEFDGIKVLISYSTPVAYYDKLRHMYFVTDKFWSKTTSRHIKKWLSGEPVYVSVSQHALNALVAEVK